MSVLIRGNHSGKILTAEQMRAAEAAVFATGVSVDSLMERAGAAVAEAIWRFGGGRDTLIACGPGNNGGDGYVAARILKARGLDVRVAALCDPKTEPAINARRQWDGPVEPLVGTGGAAVLVDALFGTGLTRALDRTVCYELGRLAASSRFNVAVDLPSGVGTDDGSVMGVEDARDYRAHLTLALGACKPAHFLYPAADYCGDVKLLDIGVRAESDVAIDGGLPNRPPHFSDNKYDRAVAVVAGEMPGAAQLAAGAASHIAGITLLATDSVVPNSLASIIQRPLDAIILDRRFKTFVVGPGLGTDSKARSILEILLSRRNNLVLDADALTILSEIGFDAVRSHQGQVIMTPHEGEFKRLFGPGGGSKIDRARAAAAISNATIIYKGPDTVVAQSGRSSGVTVFPAASHWLASAGTGDVLAGLAGAFLSIDGLGAGRSASAAVVLHGQIAELIGPGLCADDMPRHIRQALRENGYV